MLLCNGVRIDTTKKEGIHQWVKSRMDQLVKEYKLNRGQMATIDYLKSAIVVDPVTKKKTKPASLGIDFYEKYFNEDKDYQEIQEWRYCDSMTERIGQKPLFYPSGLSISGARSFGFKDIELIFFLKYISSRVENGENNKGNNKKYFRFEDKFKEAEEWRKEEQVKAYIKNCLIGDETTGGLKDKDIRNIAAALIMSRARDEDYPISFLRKELYDLVVRDSTSHQKVSELIGTVNGESVKIMGDIAEAKQLRLIDVRKISNVPHWVFLKKDNSTAAKIIKVPAGVSTPEGFLKDYYLSNPEEYKYFIESLVELKGIKE